MDYRAELERYEYECTPVGSNDVMIICPFHSDNDPSLGVNIRNGIFHCFGCGESGPFYKLMAEIKGISVEESRKNFYEDETVEEVIDSIQDLMVEMLPPVVQYFSIRSFHKVFPSVFHYDGGISYLKRREIDQKSVLMFDIRFGVRGLYKDRIILPIYTHKDCKLLSWAARTIHKAKPKTRKKRAARSTLYGLCNYFGGQQFFIQPLDYLIVVEGEFDAIYLQQLGFKAVASMGTSGLTAAQMALLLSCCKKVILSYDGDVAGEEASEKDAANLKHYLPTFAVSLPNGKDPNDLSKEQLFDLYRKFL